MLLTRELHQLDPRPAGVWWHADGGGGGKGPPGIYETNCRIGQIQAPFDRPVRELSEQSKKFT